LDKLDERKKKKEDYILTEDEKNILNELDKKKKENEDYILTKDEEEILKKNEGFKFTQEEQIILNELELEEEEKEKLNKLESLFEKTSNKRYNELRHICIRPKKLVSSFKDESSPPKSNLSINSAYFNADGRLHEPESMYVRLEHTNPLARIPSNLNDGSNDNEEPIRPNTDSLVNSENEEFFVQKQK